jgi:glyoxylase-like metal-dependent hydrolase (beta-lactamase superfamily II)
MSRLLIVSATSALIALIAPARSQAPAEAPSTPPAAAPAQPAAPATRPGPPPFATTKVDGTDNVYIFRYGGHQSMFVVTPAGVIATDPIGLRRPQAVTAYIAEIRKVTPAPIRYVIYSHHHYDHIAGGKPFKDLGAKFIAHKRAKQHLLAMKNPDVVVPDETVDRKKTIKLGGTTLELTYVGRNHSDNSLVMRLPKEKLLFAVDFVPVEALPWRNMPDNASPVEWEDGVKTVLAMDWERMIPGHPGPGGRLGTKADVQTLLAFMQDLSAEVKKAADAGKCIDGAMREVKLPKYETLGDYDRYLAGNVERFCYWWGVGY